ncbi:MAG: hypothetical protein QW514_09360 [Thermoprotei archaeon]
MSADGKEFSKLGAMGKVNNVFGDSAYDSRDTTQCRPWAQSL